MLWSRYCLCAILTVALAGPLAAADPSRAELEKQFSETLSGSVLVGTFSVDGVKTDKPALEERYELKSVKKFNDKLWTFTARIKYMKHDVTLPVTVPVVWAGDTPMITLTDFAIPGLGEAFSARVLFYDGRYAGTWQHGKFGGHMWGKIEKPSASKSPIEAEKPSA